MKSILFIFFSNLILFSWNASVAYAQDLDWQSHYLLAEKAYANHNLFEARHEFLQALKSAQECHEHKVLAEKIETLANNYIEKQDYSLANPLLKLSQKLKTKFQNM